jgi:iron uptake system component EfeO
MVAASAVVAFAVSGCGSSSKTTADSSVTRVEITLTDAGCEPARIEIASGRSKFEITNDGAEKVTEFEVLDGDKVLGEKENLTPGLSGDFTITLKAGTYRTLCPNGTTAPEGKLVVTG